MKCCRASKLYDASLVITFTTVHGLGMDVAFTESDYYLSI